MEKFMTPSLFRRKLVLSCCLLGVLPLLAGSGNLEGAFAENTKRSIQAGVANIDTVTGQMEVLYQAGPILPSRIGLSHSSHFQLCLLTWLKY
jgi:hypothetical protein